MTRHVQHTFVGSRHFALEDVLVANASVQPFAGEPLPFFVQRMSRSRKPSECPWTKHPNMHRRLVGFDLLHERGVNGQKLCIWCVFTRSSNRPTLRESNTDDVTTPF